MQTEPRHRAIPRPVLVGLPALVCLATLSAVQPVAGQLRQPGEPLVQVLDTLAGALPGDIVRVWVWRESDFSGDFPVDSRGRVILPLLGEVEVSGKGIDRLTDELRNSYLRFLNNPSIRITVLRRIGIQGAVARPGLYPVDATVSISEIIALAGGVSPNGNPRKIRLLRGDSVVLAPLAIGTILERSAVQSGDLIYVPEKSWFRRNSTVFLAATLSGLTAILVYELGR